MADMADILAASLAAATAADASVAIEHAEITATAPLTIKHRGVESADGVTAATGITPAIGRCLIARLGPTERVIITLIGQ